MTISPGDVAAQETSPATSEGPGKVIEGRSLRQIAWARLRRDKVAMVSLVCIVVIVVIAAFAPLITRVIGVDPYSFNNDLLDEFGLPKGGLVVGGGYSGITLDHPLGIEPTTGRDLFARLLYGARVSLLIGFCATLVSVILGTVLGMAAGYFRGWVDSLVSRFMDLLLAFPQLLMLIALTPVFVGKLEDIGLRGNTARVIYLIGVIGFFGWPYFGRIIRGQVLSLREREFVDAARSLGASSRHVLFRQLLPNLWAPILVFATLIMPSYIATEAALSYLSVGVIPPTPTWGNMLGDSVRYALVDPAYLIIPGTALFLVVLVMNLFGDGLRDALDPKTGR